MTSTIQRTILLCILMACSLQVSNAWVANGSPKSNLNNNKKHTTSTTAKFYTSPSTITPEDAAKVKSILSPKTSKQSLESARQIPWIQDDADAPVTSFLEHWNWQLDFLEQNLSNLRVRDYQHPDASIHDLYYATKCNSQDDSETTERVYTISLESDEYRDIRMTYMHCTGMETFRCLSYPRNGDLPVQGMFIMKMGGGRQHLSIMDYQPLPASDKDQQEINEIYTNALLALRAEIPTMSQPMTHRHFDSDEERKYFSELPLLGRCGGDENTEEFFENLWKAQKRYLSTHVALTKNFGHEGASSDTDYVLERHAEFDTHVSTKEPAGPFLRNVFGQEMGGRIHQKVVFPLSRNEEDV